MNTRRKFLLALTASALGPRWAAAQRPTSHRVGWLSLDRADGSVYFESFRTGLRELGYVEGKNLEIHARWGNESLERMASLAGELVQVGPQVVVTQAGSAMRAMLKTGSSIPIVFAFSGDPVEAGLVDRLARPGRNLTGVSFLALDLVGKRVELLKELLPAIRQVAVLANPEHPGDQSELRVSQEAAKKLGVSLRYHPVRSLLELDGALGEIAKARSDAVVVFPEALTLRHRGRIAEFGLKQRIPVVSGWGRYAESGCLMSYGPNLSISYRSIARFVDRILKGASPAELPVELPTIVELVVNSKTAKTLGITIPQSILVRADRVIE